MALRKTYTDGDGNSVDGYFRVRELRTQYEKDKGEDAVLNFSCQLETFDYSNIAESANGDQLEGGANMNMSEAPLISGVFELPSDCASSGVSSLTEAAYRHLKTLEIFDGAEDC